MLGTPDFTPSGGGEKQTGNGRVYSRFQVDRQISPRIVNLGATHDETKPVRLGSFAFLPLLVCIAGTGLDIGHEMTGYITKYTPRQDSRLSERSRNRATYPLLQASSGHQRMDDMALLSIIDALFHCILSRECPILKIPLTVVLLTQSTSDRLAAKALFLCQVAKNLVPPSHKRSQKGFARCPRDEFEVWSLVSWGLAVNPSATITTSSCLHLPPWPFRSGTAIGTRHGLAV